MTKQEQFASELHGSLETKMNSIEAKLSLMVQTLARIEANQFSAKASGKAITSEAGTSRQVHSVAHDLDDDNDQLGYRRNQSLGSWGIHNVLKNGNGRLKKIVLPLFDGFRPYGWITQAECFFRLGDYNDMDKLDLMSVSLQGPALHWYSREVERETFQDWPQFKRRMVARFSPKLEEYPGKRLFSLRQTCSIVDCVNEFDELSKIVTDCVHSQEVILENKVTQELICVKESTETASSILDRESVEEELTTTIQDHKSQEIPTSNLATACVLQPQPSESLLFARYQEALCPYVNESWDQVQSQSSQSCLVSDVLPSNFGIGGLFALQEEQLNVFHDTKLNELEQKSTSVIDKKNAYKSFDGMSHPTSLMQTTNKQRKYSKSWHFKFKKKSQIREVKDADCSFLRFTNCERNNSLSSLRSLSFKLEKSTMLTEKLLFEEECVAVVSTPQEKSTKGEILLLSMEAQFNSQESVTVVFKATFKLNTSSLFRDLPQFIIGDMKFQLIHKGKSKLLLSRVVEELCLVPMVQQNLQKMTHLFTETNCELVLRIHDTGFALELQVIATRAYDLVKFLTEAKPLQSLQFLKQDNKFQFLWYLEVLIHFFIRRDSSGRIKLLCDVVKFQVWHKWRSKQSETVSDLELCWGNVVVLTMSDTNFAYSACEQQRMFQSVLGQIVWSKSHNGYIVEHGIFFLKIKLVVSNTSTHIALFFTTFKYKHQTILETTDSLIPKHSCKVFDR